MNPQGGDRSLQRRFPVDEILFQSGDICNKVANGVVENYVFRPQNFREKRPPKSDAYILWSYMGTHQVGKFGAIPPTDPDDIS